MLLYVRYTLPEVKINGHNEENMSYQEKRIVATIVSAVLVFGGYYAVVIQMAQNGRFDGADATALLGKSILVLIFAGIVLNILITIAFNILFAIAGKESNPSFVVDERDKLIELRGLRTAFRLTSVGVILAMGALALGYSIFLVLNMIVASFAVGDLIGNIVMLRNYRRGF